MHDGTGRIVVQNLTKQFGPVAAVQNLSFTVEPGSVTGFLGPNGAGKTTTLRMLLGLVTPTAGIGLINGRPFAQLGNPARVVGAVLEAQGFHPKRTARDHLRVYAAAIGVPDSRADQVLQLVGLGARELAGGLALREPHRSASVPEAVVPRCLEQFQELVELTRRGRWTGLLTERHRSSQPPMRARRLTAAGGCRCAPRWRRTPSA